MNTDKDIGIQERRLTEDGVREELLQQPYLMMKLAENSLIVAESLRNNYFKRVLGS